MKQALLLAFAMLFVTNIMINAQEKKSKNVTTLTMMSFKSQISKGLVLVDFWAEWCGPCKRMSPNIDALADKYLGKLKVCKLNVDEGGNLGKEYYIQNIPCLVLFKDGKEIDRLIGYMEKEQLEKNLEKHLK